LADKLAEYAWMDARNEIPGSENESLSSAHRNWVRRAVWAIGLLAVAMITVLALGAYRQPELLLNLMGLRYCG
jgi:hypothetical protein